MRPLPLIAGICMLSCTVAIAHAQSSTRVPTITAATVRTPTIPNVDSVTGNPWLQTGIDALASVSANYSVSVPSPNSDTLAARINQVHQGMTMAGWRLVGTEAVQKQGTTIAVLLTYGRREK